jgi:hypothetical protein
MSGQDDRKQEFWVDYIEKELDPSTQEDLDRLLTHSREDVRLVEDLKNLRSSVKKADPAVKTTEFNQKLFNSIMAETSEAVIEPRWKLYILRPRIIASVAASFIAVLVGWMITGSISPNQRVVQTTQDNDWLMQASMNNPTALADIVNDYHSDEDFALDALSQQMGGLSDDEMAARFEEILDE